MTITRRCFTQLCLCLTPISHLINNILLAKSPEKDTLVIVIDKPVSQCMQAVFREECKKIPDIHVVTLYGVEAHIVGKKRSFYCAGGRRFRVIADGQELKHCVWCDIETGLVCSCDLDRNGNYVISNDRVATIVHKYDDVKVEPL